jgi:hypothetical protein
MCVAANARWERGERALVAAAVCCVVFAAAVEHVAAQVNLVTHTHALSLSRSLSLFMFLLLRCLCLF